MKLLRLFALLLITVPVLSQEAYVIAENANLRGTPSLEGKVVDVLSEGVLLEVIKQKGPWFLVQSTDYAGWIHGDTIKLTNSPTVFRSSQIQVPKTVPSLPPTPSRRYIRGPRGGCYYINSNGNKTYVSRDMCG